LDVHQAGDGPLMRAALFGHRIPMMELLVSRGADVNALGNGYFPVLFAPCETVEPAPLKWLVDRGADPNLHCSTAQVSRHALDYLISTYGRSPELGAGIDTLLEVGTPLGYALQFAGLSQNVPNPKTCALLCDRGAPE